MRTGAYSEAEKERGQDVDTRKHAHLIVLPVSPPQICVYGMNFALSIQHAAGRRAWICIGT